MATIYIRRGDSYDGVANNVLVFTVTKDFDSWSGTFTVRHRSSNAVLVSASAAAVGPTIIQVSLDADETTMDAITNDEDFGPHPYEIQMTSGSSVQTAVTGVAILQKDFSAT